MDRYAVMGNPVAHSKSPRIHEAFARQFGIELSYEAIRVEPGTFPDAVHRFHEAGGRGLNITVPFKHEAWRLAGVRTAGADMAQAVNTIRFEADGGVFGDTTDGRGLMRDLHNARVTIAGRRVLLIGAGGAVNSVLSDLLDAQPASLILANRTLEKAAALADRFETGAAVMSVKALDELEGLQFDVVINGTSASLHGERIPLPEKLLAQRACCYDMVYGDAETCFLQWAREQGAAVLRDGLGMLVEQAAESFFIWRGVRPDTAPVMQLLRNPSP
jgi:shikimate dehydrogenase